MANSLGTVRIDKRYCGPPKSGNGGYSCGLLANFIEGAANVRLSIPPPLDTDIQIISEDSGIGAYVEGAKIGQAAPAYVDINLPKIPTREAIKKARQIYLDDADNHPLDVCFVCGPKRQPDDGLCLFTGPIENSTVNADFWSPNADHADEDGLVRPEILWAALDCPTFFALRNGNTKFCLLGSLTAEVYRRPKSKEELIIMAWARGVDGRKLFGDCAIVDEKGEIIAASNAVWIEITDPKKIEMFRASS